MTSESTVRSADELNSGRRAVDIAVGCTVTEDLEPFIVIRMQEEGADKPIFATLDPSGARDFAVDVAQAVWHVDYIQDLLHVLAHQRDELGDLDDKRSLVALLELVQTRRAERESGEAEAEAQNPFAFLERFRQEYPSTGNEAEGGES